MYWCSIFILPKKTILTIERMCRNFLWTGKWNCKGMPMVAWKDVCLPKREGGLGIKQLEVWNNAAISKYIWRLLHSNASDIWVTWAKMRLREANLWAASIPQDCAWSWRKILGLGRKLREVMSIQIGDGIQSSLFYDSWLPGGRPVMR